MPFIELRDQNYPDKVVIVNTESIVTVEANQGTYGPIFKIRLRDGNEIMTSYSTFQDAEKKVAAVVKELGGNIPLITL